MARKDRSFVDHTSFLNASVLVYQRHSRVTITQNVTLLQRGCPLPDSARMRLFFGLCSTSANPLASSNGGTYIPKRPRSPVFNPYQPPTGLSGERAHASTVPAAGGFCSSALPRSIQPPSALSIYEKFCQEQIIKPRLCLVHF